MMDEYEYKEGDRVLACVEGRWTPAMVTFADSKTVHVVFDPPRPDLMARAPWVQIPIVREPVVDALVRLAT